jgi:hypothetical protein
VSARMVKMLLDAGAEAATVCAVRRSHDMAACETPTLARCAARCISFLPVHGPRDSRRGELRNHVQTAECHPCWRCACGPSCRARTCANRMTNRDRPLTDCRGGFGQYVEMVAGL